MEHRLEHRQQQNTNLDNSLRWLKVCEQTGKSHCEVCAYDMSAANTRSRIPRESNFLDVSKCAKTKLCLVSLMHEISVTKPA